jgi:hypothetical protein
VLVATVLVPIPAALTVDRYNAIRLAALPVFLLVLAIPALDGLVNACRRSWWARVAATVLVVSAGIQFAQFLDSYRTRGPARLVLFDAGVEPLLDRPFAAGETIYVTSTTAALRRRRAGTPRHGLLDDRVVILADGGFSGGIARLPAVPGLRLRVRRGRSLGGVPAGARGRAGRR